MNEFTKRCAVLLLFCISSIGLFAQDGVPDDAGVSDGLAVKYLHSVSNKLERQSAAIDRATQKLLLKITRLNKRQKNKLPDSIAALLHINETAFVLQPVQQATDGVRRYSAESYNPYLDTLTTVTAFLKKILPGNASLQGTDAGVYLRQLQSLQAQYTRVQAIETAFNTYRKQLQQLPGNCIKALKKPFLGISKEYYYYNAHLTEYKTLLAQPEKIEERLLAVVRELPAFKEFIKNNSALAGLFQLPDAPQAGINGLQTRSAMEALLKEKLSFTNADGRGMVAAQLEAAKTKLDELKNKLPGEDAAGVLPDFKPKEIKTKSFLQRTELGINLKFAKSSAFLPSSSELMLQAGYKVSDKVSFGAGFTHRLGWPQNSNHISFAHLGTGISSYFKMKLKGNFYMSGGWEENHFTGIKKPGDITKQEGWKSSALLGLGKKINIGKSPLGNKWGRGRPLSNSITVLYDFLYQQHNPVTEAVKLRLGICF
jgi:hypothetical protein